jgi:hypothetical protein
MGLMRGAVSRHILGAMGLADTAEGEGGEEEKHTSPPRQEWETRPLVRVTQLDERVLARSNDGSVAPAATIIGYKKNQASDASRGRKRPTPVQRHDRGQLSAANPGYAAEWQPVTPRLCVFVGSIIPVWRGKGMRETAVLRARVVGQKRVGEGVCVVGVRP